tara:strand:- start:14430 stop:15515 length:1086 start_codon:yes stop_codon:yes gene_type:complete
MRLTLLSFIFVIPFAQSQISLDETDFFAVEDTVRVSETMDMGIDFATTGANSVWDFSNLTANSQRLEKAYSISSAGAIVGFQFGPTAPPQYVSDYYRPFDGIPFEDFSNFLPVNIQDINRIVKIDSDSLRYTGYSFNVDGQQVGFRSDTIEAGYKFPIEFGDTYSSRGYTNMDFNPIFNAIFRQYRQRASEVDGHGTLITPYSTFNTLRIHHTINEQDSLYVDIQGFATWVPIERTTHQYEWWAKGEKRPVFAIQTEEVNGGENVTGITYIDEYLGLDASLSSEEHFETSIYPNPAKSKISITSEFRMENITIVDALGKKVLMKNVDSKSELIDTNGLVSGVYSVIIQTNKGSQVSKLIIE